MNLGQRIKRRCGMSLANPINRLGIGHFFPFYPKGDLRWYSTLIQLLATTTSVDSYLEVGIARARIFNTVGKYVSKAVAIDIDVEAEKFITLKKYQFLGLDSTTALDLLIEKRQLFDLIFIDGDHSKEMVLNDFRKCIKLVKQDGLILLHDAYPEAEQQTTSLLCGDAYLAIEELSRDTNDWEMVTIPVYPGITICRKRSKQVPWQQK
jgi:predicted O-methyltransferase YrrM